MIDIGRLCMKIAGRDAGQICVIVQRIDDNFVMIDGQTRRRKCNIKHLELMNKVIELNENASHDEIKAVFEKLNLVVRNTKPKKIKERTIKSHKKKAKPVKVSKDKKKTAAAKKEAKSAEAKVERKEPSIKDSDIASAYVEKEVKKTKDSSFGHSTKLNKSEIPSADKK